MSFMGASLWWPVILEGSAVAAGLVVLSEGPSLVRVAVVCWFLLICPGMAFVRLLGIEERLTELTLAIAVSMAIELLIAQIMVFFRIWAPRVGLAGLICLTLGGAILQLVHGYHRFVDAKR
ncbi:MAG: hypothetical protein QXI12_13465 [Candidatus Methanomethyliaceae archaeon]